MISLSTDGLESVFDSDILPHTQESQDCIDIPTMDDFGEILMFPERDTAEVVKSEATPKQILLLVTNDCEPLPLTTSETNIKDIENDKSLHETPNGKGGPTPTSSNKRWDVTSRKNLKSRKHPALIANVPKKTLFDELTQAKLELVEMQKAFLEAEIIEKKKVWEFGESERKKKSVKLELVQLQKDFLEAEINEKKKVWEFEENERKKESEFKEMERKWKEVEYKLKLENNFK